MTVAVPNYSVNNPQKLICRLNVRMRNGAYWQLYKTADEPQYSTLNQSLQMSVMAKAPSLSVNGYKVNFVEPPPDSFYCSTCSTVLREPRIAECCGKTSCLTCIDSLVQKKEACPFCKVTPLIVSVNRQVRNRINESKVYCPGKEKGCQTAEKFEAIAKHVDQCGYVEIVCPHNCGANLVRSQLESHLQTCKRVPLTCKCGKTVVRSLLEEHKRICPLSKIKCPFSIVGCTAEVLNKDFKVHYEKSLADHLDMVNKQSKVVANAVKQAKQTMVANYDKRMKAVDAEIGSVIKEITATEEKAKALSKLLTDLEGEILYTEAEGKTSKEAFEADIAAKEFRANGLTQQANSLQLRLKVKKLGPAVPRYPAYPVVPRPTQPMGNQLFIAPVTFQIPNFTERVTNDELWFSPPFFTHRGGYKFCLRVYCNGYGQGHSKWLSIYAELVRGENDHKLHWPFSGKFTITIPNKLKNSHHQVKTIAFDHANDPNCGARKRVSKGYFADENRGHWNFITQSVLFPSSLTLFPDFKYIVDDKLEISVTNVGVY